VIGGSSSINGLAYVRGHRGDSIAGRQGLSQWSYANVLPYFRRSESWEAAPLPLRRRRAARHDVSEIGYPINEAILEAGKLAGFAFTEVKRRAAGRLLPRASTIKNGKRCSAAVAFSSGIGARQQSDGRSRSHVARIIFEGTRAVGVE